MAAEATTNIWAILWPVIVGGLIAVLGSAIGPIIAHLLNARTSRREKIEKQLEAIVTYVYENDHWLDQKKNVSAYGEKIDLPYAPISKALSLAAIHFPDMLPSLDDIDHKAAHYQLWMIKATEHRLNGNMDKVNDGFREAYQPYAASVKAFQASIPGVLSTQKL